MRVCHGVVVLSFAILLGCGGEVAVEWDASNPAAQDRASLSAREPNAMWVMAANLTAGRAQSYDTGEGLRMFQGLRPDVALVQELNIGANTDQEVRAFVDEAFGPEFTYFREADAELPNAIVSRFPILAAGQWQDPHISNRDFAWARLDLPGSRELFAVSVHLSAGNNSVRTAQAKALVELLQREVPPGDFLVVGGDLNVGSGPPINEMGRIVQTSGKAPADAHGNRNTNASRKKRLDWVLSDGTLESMEIPVAIGDQLFPNGLVFDSRRFDPLHLVAPVQESDSGAFNMQHMPVVRAFTLPGAVNVQP